MPVQQRKTTTQRGLAITTILLAVVLVAALAVAVAISARSSNADGNKEQMKQIAIVMLNQAQIYANGFHNMEANGIPFDTITFDGAANTGLWNPVVGGALQQVPLPRIGTVTPGFYWEYYGQGKAVQFPNIGTQAGAEYYLWTDYQKEEVCHQLNQMLFNDPTIPTSIYTCSNGKRAHLMTRVTRPPMAARKDVLPVPTTTVPGRPACPFISTTKSFSNSKGAIFYGC